MHSSQNIIDLYSSYPFLNAGSSGYGALDARVTFTITKGDWSRIISRNGLTTATFVVSMTAIQMPPLPTLPGSASMQCTCQLFTAPLMTTVPIVVGRDTPVPAGSDYLRIDLSAVTDDIPVPVRLHPDCVRFNLEHPSIRLMSRGPVKSDDGLTGSDGKPIDGQVGGDTVASTNHLTFVSGHNAQISFNEDTLLMEAGSGLGQDIYEQPPFVDYNPNQMDAPIGLRSINGFTGNVTITGSESVKVDMTGDTLMINAKHGQYFPDTVDGHQQMEQHQ